MASPTTRSGQPRGRAGGRGGGGIGARACRPSAPARRARRERPLPGGSRASRQAARGSRPRGAGSRGGCLAGPARPGASPTSAPRGPPWDTPRVGIAHRAGWSTAAGDAPSPDDDERRLMRAGRAPAPPPVRGLGSCRGGRGAGAGVEGAVAGREAVGVDARYAGVGGLEGVGARDPPAAPTSHGPHRRQHTGSGSGRGRVVPRPRAPPSLRLAWRRAARHAPPASLGPLLDRRPGRVACPALPPGPGVPRRPSRLSPRSPPGGPNRGRPGRVAGRSAAVDRGTRRARMGRGAPVGAAGPAPGRQDREEACA
jgi:hypothetical protein